MTAVTTERLAVGRPKKQNKPDLRTIKLAHDVYRNIGLIAKYQDRDIYEVATELLRGPSEKVLAAEKAKDDARLGKEKPKA